MLSVTFFFVNRSPELCDFLGQFLLNFADLLLHNFFRRLVRSFILTFPDAQHLNELLVVLIRHLFTL